METQGENLSFADWVDWMNITQMEVAELIGASQASVHEWYYKKREPSLRQAIRMVEASKGRVKFKELLRDETLDL